MLHVVGLVVEQITNNVSLMSYLSGFLLRENLSVYFFLKISGDFASVGYESSECPASRLVSSVISLGKHTHYY